MSLDESIKGKKVVKEKNIQRIYVLEDSWIRLVSKIKQAKYPKTSDESKKVSGWTIFISAILTYIPYLPELKNLLSVSNEVLKVDYKLLIITILYAISMLASLLFAIYYGSKQKAEKKIYESDLQSIKEICDSIQEESGYNAHKKEERALKKAKTQDVPPQKTDNDSENKESNSQNTEMNEEK